MSSYELSYEDVKKKCLPAPPKVPPEFQRCKQEYLFLRGINIECRMFINFFFRFKEEYPESNVFDTPQCHRLESFFKRFLKAQELGYLGDLSEVHFHYRYLSEIEDMKFFMLDSFDNNDFSSKGEKMSALKLFDVLNHLLMKFNIDESPSGDRSLSDCEVYSDSGSCSGCSECASFNESDNEREFLANMEKWG